MTKPRQASEEQQAHVARILEETAERRAAAAEEDARAGERGRTPDDDHRSDGRDHLR